MDSLCDNTDSILCGAVCCYEAYLLESYIAGNRYFSYSYLFLDALYQSVRRHMSYTWSANTAIYCYSIDFSAINELILSAVIPASARSRPIDLRFVLFVQTDVVLDHNQHLFLRRGLPNKTALPVFEKKKRSVLYLSSFAINVPFWNS